jgi:hypothetical protein
MPLTSNPKQPFLFSEAQMRSFARPVSPSETSLEMDDSSLKSWKDKIADYQNQSRMSQATFQGSLFSSVTVNVDADLIDPFGLEIQNFFFFNWPVDRNPNDPCIYFVIDTAMPLLLYVGETCKVNQRWAGYHDCKRYVLNYQNLHFKHQSRTMINIAFWWDTPSEMRSRQALEARLIHKWRSPFNKENWSFWGTPFVYRDAPPSAHS